MKYVKPERIFLKDHPDLNERWVQDRIAEDPSLLGLGTIILKDKERLHPRAGRLDLLCQDQDPESKQRYEIEIQLGRTDESHIIRTIEYWDIERKRYPQYQHTAVIVAEDITSRFLNVINLFNGFIPLIAIQMRAFANGDQVTLIFSTVLNKVDLGLVEEDEPVHAIADRSFWEKGASKQTLELVDTILAILKTIDPKLNLKYNKSYIGLSKDGNLVNLAFFTPQKQKLWLGITLERSDDIQSLIDQTFHNVAQSYEDGCYWLKLSGDDIQRYNKVLTDLLRRAYDEATK